jgi:hypothetical protein
MNVCLISSQKTSAKEIYPPTEAPNSQGMGKGRKWYRGGPEVSNPSPNPLSVEENPGTGRSDLYGKKPHVDPWVRKLERENQKLKEALLLQTQEFILLKKDMNLV